MTTEVRPWYRETWPWLIMSGPAVVVVAGIYTAMLAVRSDDGLVADDYYKEGLAINKAIQRDAVAAARKIKADASFGPAGDITLRLTGAIGDVKGDLNLRVLHPTRSGLDLQVRLKQVEVGRWEGNLKELPRGEWLLQLQSPDSTWRIAGVWQSPNATATLEPASTGPQP